MRRPAIGGIDQLREKISTASDAKEIADLQARLHAQNRLPQTDVLRMEGCGWWQQAQAQVDDSVRRGLAPAHGHD